MLTILSGPVMFAIAMVLFLAGLVLMIGAWRQAWVLLGFGMFGFAFAVTDWLMMVAFGGCIACFVGYFYWTKRNIGKSM